MRTKKAGLEVVLEQFEARRAKPHGRLIPDELWNAALGLLDRYTPSTICSHLRLNAQRFEQIGEGRSVAVGESGPMGLGRPGAARRGRRDPARAIPRERRARPGRFVSRLRPTFFATAPPSATSRSFSAIRGSSPQRSIPGFRRGSFSRSSTGATRANG